MGALLFSFASIACHRQPAANASLAQVQQNTATATNDARILCATGAAPLAPSCTFSREQNPAGLVVTIQRANGAFRRLLVTRDGHGIAAADGAQAARVSLAGRDAIDVAIGGDRYRLPATIRAGAR